MANKSVEKKQYVFWIFQREDGRWKSSMKKYRTRLWAVIPNGNQ